MIWGAHPYFWKHLYRLVGKKDSTRMCTASPRRISNQPWIAVHKFWMDILSWSLLGTARDFWELEDSAFFNYLFEVRKPNILEMNLVDLCHLCIKSRNMLLFLNFKKTKCRISTFRKNKTTQGVLLSSLFAAWKDLRDILFAHGPEAALRYDQHGDPNES